jgi:hypothetical protein
MKMPMTPRTLVLIASLAACGDSTLAPSGDDVRVSVAEEDAALAEQAWGVSGTITVRVAKDLPVRILRPTGCGASLERQVGGAWVEVWVVSCILVQLPPEWIEAGETAAVDVPVFATLDDDPTDRWTRPLEGAYRVRLILPTTHARALERVTSNPFTPTFQ